MEPKKFTRDQLSCAFCGKNGSEVSALIAGKHAFICGECLNACNEIIWAPLRKKYKKQIKKYLEDSKRGK